MLLVNNTQGLNVLIKYILNLLFMKVTPSVKKSMRWVSEQCFLHFFIGMFLHWNVS